MKFLLYPFYLFLLQITIVTRQASANDLVSMNTFLTSLDEDQNVKLYWNVSTAKKEIVFTVEARTTGWIGFGISSGQGKMQGADIVIGWVKDGRAFFKDRHADDYTVPEEDSQQDYELISLTENNGKTTMKFKRKFDTCDPQDNKIEPGTTKVIYAYHPEDPSSENSIPQHSPANRGPRTVLLLNSATNRPTLPPDTKHFDIKRNKTSIPRDQTTYFCAVFEMPRLNETHHVVKIEPIIQAGNEGVVHHILIYECKDDFPDHHLNYSGICYSSNMPPPVQQCTGKSTIAGWAIGGKAFYYPEHAGYPIGAPDSPKVVILEIHYDNPENKAGMIDSSGLRFHYTKQLRKYDAGVLYLGATSHYTLLIPPKETNWEINGYCSADCTKEGFKESKLPEGGINVFAQLFHTHLAGRKTILRHIRSGKELPEIGRDEHYDFNFQEYQTLNKEVHIAPGDSLINVCIYDTTDRDDFTVGGLRTRDEMCLVFLSYYPKVNLTRCTSSDQRAFQLWDEGFVKQEYALLGKPTFWTTDVNKGLKEAYRDSKSVLSICLARDDRTLPGLGIKSRPKPEITAPYKREENCEVIGSMANSVVPGYLSALITLAYLAAFIR